MSDVNGKRCDNCDVVKFELGGWWVIVQEKVGGRITLLPFEITGLYNAKEESVHKNLFDVCGQQCLVGKVGKIVANLGAENVSRTNKGSVAGEAGGVTGEYTELPLDE